jgi:putative N-acetylmannosamine-6-phosphate epimerase
MTVSYPVGDACADVVAHGATLRARTASWDTVPEAVSRAHKPSSAAGADCAVGSNWS